MNEYQYRSNDNKKSWESIPEEFWHIILSDFVFKVADSFGFSTVGKTTDLFPKGLHYFSDWDLDEMGLVELEWDIVAQFKLNDHCKRKLLMHEFSVHQMISRPTREYRDYDEHHYYYEFDELYFFAEERLLFTYIHHESQIVFQKLNDEEIILLLNLDKQIIKDLSVD